MRIEVLHGPNLDLLGTREPALYGGETLAEIDARLRRAAAALEVSLETFQSNHEGALVDRIRDRTAEIDGWLVNAGGLTHSSVSLRDALAASRRPFVEVHLSNVFAREAFRARSLLADRAIGVVCGFRGDSYLLALRGLIGHLRADG